MASLVQRLFGTSQHATVLCPRCERAMENHDEAECSRKMSRRFFFGLCSGVVLGSASTEIISLNPSDPTIIKAGDRLSVSFYGHGAVPFASLVVQRDGSDKRHLISIGPLSSDATFWIAPERMKITDIKAYFGGHPTPLVWKKTSTVSS